jgi:hypothetical protein
VTTGIEWKVLSNCREIYLRKQRGAQEVQWENKRRGAPFLCFWCRRPNSLVAYSVMSPSVSYARTAVPHFRRHWTVGDRMHEVSLLSITEWSSVSCVLCLENRVPKYVCCGLGVSLCSTRREMVDDKADVRRKCNHMLEFYWVLGLYNFSLAEQQRWWWT